MSLHSTLDEASYIPHVWLQDLFRTTEIWTHRYRRMSVNQIPEVVFQHLNVVRVCLVMAVDEVPDWR